MRTTFTGFKLWWIRRSFLFCSKALSKENTLKENTLQLCFYWHIEKCQERVLDIIQKHDVSSPLFLFYSFHLLHTPLQVPKAWLHKIDDLVKAAGGKPIDDENRRLYAAMTFYMDSAIGEAVAALKKKETCQTWQYENRFFDDKCHVFEGTPYWIKLLRPLTWHFVGQLADAQNQLILHHTFDLQDMYDNTLIIFTSDNGGPIYEPGAASNHPLRGGKYNDWQGSRGVWLDYVCLTVSKHGDSAWLWMRIASNALFNPDVVWVLYSWPYHFQSFPLTTDQDADSKTDPPQFHREFRKLRS